MSNSNPHGFALSQFIRLTPAVIGIAMLLSACASKQAEDNSPGSPASSASRASASPASPPPAAPPAQANQPNASQAWAEKIKAAAAKPSAPLEGTGWQSMFDGTLSGWKTTAFAGHGEVETESGLLILNMGDPFTGVNYTNAFPKMGYEIALDAMRLMGSDFFCGLTVPVGDSFCSLIVGGWGGSLVGISSLDGMDASENETTKYLNFESGRWYRIRLRVTQDRIEGWIDDEKLINVLTKDRKISLRAGEIDMSTPIGIASWQTSSALRNIKLRRVDQPEGPPKKY
jgi:hypothetical protein